MATTCNENGLEVARYPAGIRVLEQRSYSNGAIRARFVEIHPKVTVSIGLRYENVPPYYDKSQKFTNLALALQPPAGTINVADPTLHPTLVRIGQGDFYQDVPFRYAPGINVARDGRLGDRGINADNKDFAPRLGIAWSPSDRWTIRAGAGVFYVQDIAAIYLDAVRANLAGSRIASANVSFPNLTFSNAFSSPLISTPKSWELR